MAFNIVNYYDDVFNKQIANKKSQAQEQKNEVNDRYNAQISKAESDTDNQIKAAENSYDAAFADNAVQKAITERQIRDSMSAAGLSDSGLNRTQLTAVQLQKANADNAVSMQKMNFINKANSALADYKYQAELDRNSELSNIDTTLAGEINSIEEQQLLSNTEKSEEIIANINSITDPTQAAAYINMVSEQYGVDANELVGYSSVLNKNTYNNYLKDKNYFVNKDEKETVREQVLTITDPTQAATYIQKMAQKYGMSEKALCSWSSVITYKEYQKFVKDKNYFNKKATYKGLHESLSGYDTTTASGQTAAAKAIKAWVNTNKKQATKSKIKKLCESAGISYSDYLKFLKNGQYFVNIQDSKKSKATASSSGKSGSKYYYEPEDNPDDNTETDESTNYGGSVASGPPAALARFNGVSEIVLDKNTKYSDVEKELDRLMDAGMISDEDYQTLLNYYSDRYN